MILRGRHEVYRVGVVERDLFAAPNSLKSHEARKVLSPFSNLYAVTHKLRDVSGVEISQRELGTQLGAALDSL
jgi:hypothetical protein